MNTYVADICTKQRFWCSNQGVVYVIDYYVPSTIPQEIQAAPDEIMAALMIATYNNPRFPPIRWQ